MACQVFLEVFLPYVKHSALALYVNTWCAPTVACCIFVLAEDIGGSILLSVAHIVATQSNMRINTIASEAAAVEWLAANPYASIAPAKDDAKPLCKPL